MQSHGTDTANENLNDFELAFVGMIIFDCKDELLIEETLKQANDDRAHKLYYDTMQHRNKGFAPVLHHGVVGQTATPTAWLEIKRPGKTSLNILKNAHAVSNHSYTKSEAWDKCQLHESFGPWESSKAPTHQPHADDGDDDDD